MARSSRWSVLLMVLLGLGLVEAGKAWVRAERGIRIGGMKGKHDLSIQLMDHATLDTLLHRYADPAGLVNYAAWRSSPTDRQALDAYLDELSRANFRRPMSRAALTAYWINSYNALTIKGVLGAPSKAAGQDRAERFGSRNRLELVIWADGQYIGLDAIEHTRLPALGDPRVWFAVSSATRGGPPLRNEAYRAERLDEQLEDNARRFFASPERFQADLASHEIRLASLLRTKAAEFGATQADRLRSLARYWPVAARSLISDPSLRVAYLDFDGRLNESTN